MLPGLPPTLARVDGQVKLDGERPAMQRSSAQARGIQSGRVRYDRRPRYTTVGTVLAFLACEEDLFPELTGLSGAGAIGSKLIVSRGKSP
jgi:hypothetical protein